MKSDRITNHNFNSLCNNSNALLLVSLENLRSNYKFLKNQSRESELGVSVKANAYGLGYKYICKTLIEVGCKTFFVATANEGLEVIKIKKNIEVYVLNGVSDEKTALSLIKKKIKLVINNIDQLEKLVAISKENNLKINCALHIDTGMNRLGLDNNQIEKIILLAKKYFKVSLIMSHLSCSENRNSEFNKLQLEKFNKIKKKFNFFKSAKFSLANSNGIFLNKSYHFSLCRPGGLVYGLNLTSLKVKGIKRTVVLLVKILQIKSIKKGDAVGYGAKYKAKKNSIIATLGIGYSDGLPRNFSGSVYYKNHKLPIIGNISMDLCTIDISNCKKLKVNDWIEIFGNSISIEEFANNCDTIAYEISSKIGSRVKRVYLNNSTEGN